MLCFFLLFFNGYLLHQTKPVFFINRLDFSLNLILLADACNTVINNYFLQVFLDVMYFMMTLFFIYACITNNKLQYLAALLNFFFNLVYILLLTSLSALSIQWFVGWILLPLLFIFKSAKSFYFAVHCMRYIFLLLFFSAGLWKIRGGGLFNIEQMSGILLKQHIVYLVAAPDNWYAKSIKFLITHYKFSYLLYLAAFAGEIIFCAGFFTRKYDKHLIGILLLFISFNFVLMKINYISWVAFAGCLWYSKYNEPVTGYKKSFAA